VSGEITHRTVAALKAIHREVLKAHGGSAGARDEALLESAIAAPQVTIMGRALISDPIEIAAAHFFYLGRNHPFVDGNKRTVLVSCLVFLEATGLLQSRKLPVDEWECFGLEVASSKLDPTQTTRRFRMLRKRLR
jgi:death on curing protein